MNDQFKLPAVPASLPPPIAPEVALATAQMAYEITQKHARYLAPGAAIPWHSLPENRRELMAAGVTRTVQALMVLGLIDTPSGEGA